MPSSTAIPSLSEWGMIMLAALLVIAGFVVIRSQAR
ncbi:MAG: IPTL-CTERM sorting domain-containing protein [Halothiobacillus sp.]